MFVLGSVTQGFLSKGYVVALDDGRMGKDQVKWMSLE